MRTLLKITSRDRDELANYRPLANLPVICTLLLFEKVVVTDEHPV